MQVVKRALRSAGIITRVAILENFVENEIVIKFPELAASKKDRQRELVPVAFQPKVEPEHIVDLEEEYDDSPADDDYGCEPADSTSHEALSLNESMIMDTASNAPFVKLERLRSKPKSTLPETRGVQFDLGTDIDDIDDGDVGDVMNFGDDGNVGDDGDDDFVPEDDDPSYGSRDHGLKKEKKPKKPKLDKPKHHVPHMYPSKIPKERKERQERQPPPYLHCTLCDYRNKSSAVLQRHVLMKHTTDKPYKCSICKFRTSVEHYLMLHMKKHPGVLPWKCDECNHQCRLASDLARHKSVIHEKAKSFKCQSCPFLGKNRAQFLRHVKCHYGNDGTGAAANHHDETDIHCMLNTTECVSRMCDLCGRKFQSGIWLEQHMKQHTDPEKYSLLCSHCDTEFQNKSSLKSHLNSLTGEAPFKCLPCDTELVYDNDLASSTAIAYTGGPRLIQSRMGNVQIHDRGYTFCINKGTKNNHTYLRCTHSEKKDSRCKATMSVEGPLQEGKFKILFHTLEKHNHEPCTMDDLDKQFNALFKDACLEDKDTSVPTLFENVKMNFLTKLSPSEQAMYEEKLSYAAKAKFMMGYRVRGYKEPEYDRALVSNESDAPVDSPY